MAKKVLPLVVLPHVPLTLALHGQPPYVHYNWPMTGPSIQPAGMGLIFMRPQYCIHNTMATPPCPLLGVNHEGRTIPGWTGVSHTAMIGQS